MIRFACVYRVADVVFDIVELGGLGLAALVQFEDVEALAGFDDAGEAVFLQLPHFVLLATDKSFRLCVNMFYSIFALYLP